MIKPIANFVSVWSILALFTNVLYSQCRVSLGPDIAICQGQAVTLTATTVSGNPTAFTWTSNPTGALPSTRSITVSPTVATTYIVRANGNGCNAHDTILVTVNPKPSAPSFSYTQSNSCSGSVVNFNAALQGAGISFKWNFGDGTTDTGAIVAHVFNSYGTGTGSFVVTATAINAAGCGNSSSQTIQVTQGPGAFLLPGSGVDTMTFNGYLTFFKCAGAAQQISSFTFLNSEIPTTGVTSTVIWGDTAAPYTTDSAWTSINHIYSRGIYSLTYIVSNTAGGCSDTMHYKVFFGSNPAGGIASLGNTDICGPGTLSFVINNYQNNTAGTIYIVSFNDSTPTLIFNHPPPDTIAHLFQKSSCGVTSSNGVTVFNNSFAARLTVQNPCGLTAGAVLPIYVSLAPIADYIPPTTICTNTSHLFVNTTIGGMAASSTGCDNTTPILWHLNPDTGWVITSGNMGSDNGFVGANYDPSSWTTGSNTLGVSFSSAGNYQMRLVAANSCYPDTVIKTFCVSAPPVPAFALTGNSGCAPVTVTTTNNTLPTGTCSPSTFSWAAAQSTFSCAPGSVTNFGFTGGTNSNSGSATLTFNNQGSYTVTLNAQNVCGTFTASQTVDVKTKPEVAISAPATLCLGQSVYPAATLQTCGGTISNYSWNFAGGTPASSGNQIPGAVGFTSPGQHNITLQVSNECGSASAAYTVTVDTVPAAHAGNDQQICSGGSVQLGSAAINGLSYSWSPSAGLSSSNISNPTVTLVNNGSSPIANTYYLTTTGASGCSSQDSVTITVFPAASVNAGPYVSVCSGQSVSLSGTFGGSATSVSWSSSNGGAFGNSSAAVTSFVPAITNGTETLTLTTNDPAGPCPAVSNPLLVTVLAPPVANAGPDTSLCSGSSIHIGGNNQPGYTYTWSPPAGLSNIHQSMPTVSFTNNTGAPVSQTYTLAVSATGCSDTAQVTVVVMPGISVSAGTPASVCAGGSVTLTGSISGGAATGSWSSASGSFSQPDSLTTIFTPSITSGIATATLTAHATSGACPAAASAVNITVNAAPVVTNNPAAQSVCSGSSSQPVLLSSNTPGTTFTWTASATNGVTGFIAGGTTSIIPAQVLTDPGATAGSVIYSITPSANGCVGSTYNYTITVNPQPQMAQVPSQTICSYGTSAAVAPASNIAGTTFNWTATSDNNLSGYISGGTGNIPAQTLNNSGSNTDSVVYVVTPVANGCPGNPVTFSISVNSLAAVNLPANQSVCSGVPTSAVSLTPTINGATFSWTAQAPNGVSGFASSGNGDIPAQTIINSGGAIATIIYTINTTAGVCSSQPQNYSITVNPIPAITALPTSSIICSGNQTNIALSSNTAGVTFTWTANASPAINGAGNGTGDSIQQTLTNTGQVSQSVVYIVYPHTNGCAGQPDTVVVNVNPGVGIQFSAADQTICSGQSTQPVTITSTTGGATFNWTAQSNGISGVSLSGNNVIPAQLLINNTDSSLTASYIITANYAGCTGQAAIYQISVNPVPHVILPVPQTICTGSSTNPVILVSSVNGSSFTWTGASQTGITGYATGGTGATIPSQTLVDTGSISGSVIYQITASAAGCVSPPVYDTITINSGLVVAPVLPQTICSGSSSQEIIPSCNVQGVTFSWAVYSYGNINGYISSGTGNIAAQTLYNNQGSSDSVVYRITATGTSCTANPADFVVHVNPIPQVNIPANQVICNGTSSAAVNLSSNISGATFTWTAVAPVSISGFTTNGTGNIPAQTLYSTLSVADTLKYFITPEANGCAGSPGAFEVMVNPGSGINVTPANSSICSGTQTNISLSSVTAGTSFTWVVNAPVSITGAGNGGGNTIQQLLTNSSSNPQIVTYIITASGTSCSNNTDTVHVTVTSGVTIQLSAGPQSICSGQSTQAVNISSPVAGAAFSWTAQSNGVTGVQSSGTDIIPAQVLTNAGTGAQAVVYTITASAANCPSQNADFTVTVNPVPVVALQGSQTICSGASTAPVVLPASISGSSFSWTAYSDSDVTGYINSGNTVSLPAQTLINNGDSTGAVRYFVTASSAGCTSPASSYVIYVNPSPDVLTPPAQTICNGATTSPVVLSSHAGNVSYTWTSSASQGVTGNIPSGSGNIPAQTLMNNSTQTGLVTYTVIPTAAGCQGGSVNFKINIYPSPVISISSLPQTVCSGQSTGMVTLSSTTSGVNLAWTANIPSGVGGAVASGNNTIPVQTLTDNRLDTFPLPLTINYNITATIASSGCPAVTSHYSVAVLPKPRVDFHISEPKGCSPLHVNVVPVTYNLGSPDSLVFNWGDGTANSTVYPSAVMPEWYSMGHTFYNTTTHAVTYYISLKLRNACFDTTIVKSVTVMPNGINAFFTTSPPTGCEPLTVTFHDQSSGASLLSWCFDYNTVTGSCSGGGAVDTAGSSITHTFNAGTHTVALYINNGYGCAHDTAFETIIVSPAPVAVFEATDHLCTQSATIFTNESTSATDSFITQYTWKFGDGNSSQDENPVHTYANVGTYNACLTVTSSYGCTSSVCHPVTIGQKPFVNFSTLNACVNQQVGRFMNSSEGADLYEWNFGDGGASTATSPDHIYSAPGNYQVKLIGTSNSCSDTVVENIAIYPAPHAAFTTPAIYGCGLPSNVQLTNTSTGAVAFEWDLGNGSTSQFVNPVVTYTMQGVYSISLIASNEFNCQDTAYSSVSIYPVPVVQSVKVQPAEGCNPLNVKFTVAASNASTYFWNFGDGTTLTSQDAFALHLYTDTGTYSVQLQVYSYSACGDTLMLPDTVVVHINPVASFDYSINENIDPENGTVQFINTSVNSSTYVWNFGDGSTSMDTSPAHMFANADMFQVQLIATNKFGCRDTAYKSLEIIKKSLYVPNAFAPEFEGGNSLVRVWKPAGIGISSYHAQIFNKWGELLWESTLLTNDGQPAEGWDGSYQQKLCQQDAYVWKIEATFIDGTRWTGSTVGKEKIKKTIGSVTLIR